MNLRSFLFVPADSEKKLAKARVVPADALILDLEDSIAAEDRPKARGLTAEFLNDKHAQSIFVRINPVASPEFEHDLAAFAADLPAGLVIPKAEGTVALGTLDARLLTLEAACGFSDRRIALLPIVTETPAAVLSLAEYRTPPPRLAALTWGAEDLSAELGGTAREADGELAFTYRIVRSLALIAAKAAGVDAIETLHADFRDHAGLERMARMAARDGFTGMLAIHPDQVEVINRAFTPSADEIAYAQRVVAAFAGGAGVASLDGKMLDQPHLKRAQSILARAAQKKREGA